MINLGNNPISSLEVVSALNSLNIGRTLLHFNAKECNEKYNPKVYLGAVQSASINWNYDLQTTGKWVSNGVEKSGSWLRK